MTRCKHHDVCDRDEHAPGVGFCILHDPDEAKDLDAFDAAFEAHRTRLRERRETARQEEGYEPSREYQDDFRRIVFPSPVDFRRHQFPEEGVSFGGAKFSDQAYFFRTTFSSFANFGGATFSDQASFSFATFSSFADFGFATFSDQASFSSAAFSGHANFDAAKFSDQADFGGAMFSGQAGFFNAKFSDQADFGFATFSDQANFSEATFSGQTNFPGATFSDYVNFGEARFSDQADFEGATFSKRANFSDADFEFVSFEKATFCGESDFYQTTFSQEAQFYRAKFESYTTFAGDDEGRIFSSGDGQPARVRFEHTRFKIPERIAFRNADLRRATFLHVDVRQFEFTSVRWARFDGGNGVYDEEARRENGDALPHGALARLYRRLKQNYEDQRDYGRGGDFHFREKEMQRLNPSTPRRTRVLLGLYHRFSGYGERLKSLWWLAKLLYVSTFVSLALGLETDGGERLEWTFENLGVSFVYNLQVALLQRPDLVQPANGWSALVQALTMILGPLFLALFALAVRQRLRR
jgi:hypothetical protein